MGGGVSKGELSESSREDAANAPKEEGEEAAENEAVGTEALDENGEVAGELKRSMTRGVLRQRKGARAVFRAADVNNDGTLNDRELLVALKKMGLKNLDMDGVTRLRQKVDTNGDGVVQFDEFVQALEFGSLTIQQEKFLQPPTWGSFDAQANMQGAGTLEQLLGCMDTQDTLRCMYSEHCNGADADREFPTTWGVLTTPSAEWDYVVGPDGIDPKTWKLRPSTAKSKSTFMTQYESMDREGEGKWKGRNRKTIEEILQETLTLKAGLLVEEVVAIRLLTGPMYIVYNQVLRAASGSGGGLKAMAVRDGNLYTNTIQAAISGISKISLNCKPPSSPYVYRGCGSSKHLSFYEQFRDDRGHVWGVEPGFLSASASKLVASPPTPAGRTATVFALRVDGPMSMPADVSFLTQFDHELEWVYNPYAHMNLAQVKEGGAGGETVYTLTVTRNCHSKTIEQIQKSSAEAVERIALSSVSRIKNSIQKSFGGAWGTAYPTSALQVVRSNDPSWYQSETHCCLSMEEVTKAYAKNRREVVEEVLSRAQAAEDFGDGVEASMQYRAGFEIVDGLWSEEEEGRLEALLGIMEKMIQAMKNGGLKVEVTDQARLAELLGENGEHKKALEVWEDVMKEVRVEDETGQDGLFIAKAFFGAADALRVTGRYSESLRVFEECCDIYSSSGLPSVTPYTAADAKEDGSTQASKPGFDYERIQTAKSSRPQTSVTDINWFQRLDTPAAKMPTEGTARGVFAIGYGATVRGIGQVFDALGRDEEALEKFKEAADIVSRYVGPRHREVAKTLLCLASTEKKLGMHPQALTSFKRALTMRRKAFGFKHTLVAECLHGIGGVLKMLGQFPEAVEAFTQEVTILRMAYGHVHLDVARGLSDIGLILEMDGRQQEALDHYEECRRVRKRLLGEDSLEVAATLFSIAKLREALGDTLEALKDAKESLRVYSMVAGDFDSKTVLRMKLVDRLQAAMDNGATPE